MPPDRDGLLSACLKNSRPDRSQIRVLLVSPRNQRVERGILKDAPPVTIAWRDLLDSRIVGSDPLLSYRRRRAAVIRTHLEAVMEPTPRASAWRNR